MTQQDMQFLSHDVYYDDFANQKQKKKKKKASETEIRSEVG